MTRPGDLFLVATIPVLLLEISSVIAPSGVSSPTPDLALFVIGFVLMHRLIVMLFEQRRSSLERLVDLPFIFVLAVCAVTMKLSIIAAALAFAGIALTSVGRVDGCKAVRARRVAFALAGVTLFIWCSRGVVLSGYPAYPSSFGGFPVDWKVPLSSVEKMHNAIVGWAREPSPSWPASLHGFGWLGKWAVRTGANVLVRIWGAALVVAGTFFLTEYFRSGRKLPLGRSSFIPLLPVIVAILFWFATAPDPRFVGSLPWAGVCWLGVLALQYHVILSKFFLVVTGASGALLVAISPFRVDQWKIDRFGFAKIPRVEIDSVVTASGLRVWIPKEGEKIWDQKLPNAPGHVASGLRLRRRGLAQGFRIETVPESAGQSQRASPDEQSARPE